MDRSQNVSFLMSRQIERRHRLAEKARRNSLKTSVLKKEEICIQFQQILAIFTENLRPLDLLSIEEGKKRLKEAYTQINEESPLQRV